MGLKKSIIGSWNKLSSWKKVWITGLLFVAANLTFSNWLLVNWQGLMWSDMAGYYQWLPAVFIKHDILAQPYAFYLPYGTPFNRYTYGVSILILPFFLVSHLYSLIMGLPTDGRSAVYGASIVAAAITWCYVGLYLLYRELKKQFPAKASFITVFMLFFASNIFYYSDIESGMSHVFGFFLVAWIVFSTPRFWAKPNVRNSIWLAIPLGIAVLIRPTNLVLSFYIILYGIHSFKALKERIAAVFGMRDSWLIFFVIGILFWIPQSYYWHATTGDWITYPYKYSFTPNETFRNLESPKIFQVLLSPRSGWLLYSPFMILAVIGLYKCARLNKFNIWGILLPFLLILYFDASWWIFTFACSFGYRALIETYPLLVIPLGLIVTQILAYRKVAAKITVIFFACILLYTNVRMSYIYNKAPCWDGKNWGWPQYNLIWNKVFWLSNYRNDIPPCDLEEAKPE